MHIKQAIHIDYVRGDVTTDSGIVKNIKLLDPIKLHNLVGELPVKGSVDES